MKTVLTVIAVGFVAAFGFAAMAAAAPESDGHKHSTPSGWKYDVNGKSRVPKGDRKVNRDGSWREEIRDRNNCVTVKEKTSSGEYKESRHC